MGIHDAYTKQSINEECWQLSSFNIMHLRILFIPSVSAPTFAFTNFSELLVGNYHIAMFKSFLELEPDKGLCTWRSRKA